MRFCSSALIAAMLMIGGCTTIDITQVSHNDVSEISSVDNRNVVERAAAKLMQTFSDRGWNKKFQNANLAQTSTVLLKGRQEAALNVEAGQDDMIIIISEDVTEAIMQVENTTKAAEIFLETANDDMDLRHELKILERTLIQSRQAQETFSAALDVDNQIDQVKFRGEFNTYVQHVDTLRNVTNAYGERVRASVMPRKPSVL